MLKKCRMGAVQWCSLMMVLAVLPVVATIFTVFLDSPRSMDYWNILLNKVMENNILLNKVMENYILLNKVMENYFVKR